MMLKSNYRSSIPFTLALWGLIMAPIGIPTPVQAQSLEEVVVTAQKREESLQDAPISLAVFGADDLENIGVTKAGDIGEYTPNLSIRQQPSSFDNYGVAIRGVAAGETSAIVEPTVGIYFDGVYFGATIGGAFDLNDIERIEVLRGPQGTLYGRNTIGGAINVITRRPTGELGFNQRLSSGGRDFFGSRTSLDTPSLDLGWGELALSLTYYHEERGGTVENLADGSELGDYQSESFRIAAQLTVGEVLFDYTYTNSQRETRPNISQLSHYRPGHLAVGGPVSTWAATRASASRIGSLSKYFNLSGDPDQFSDIENHALTIQYDTAWGTLKYIGSYREWESGGTATSDFSSNNFSDPADLALILALDANGIPRPLTEARDISLFYADRDTELEQQSHELQLVGTAWNDQLEYAAGLFYYDQEIDEVNPQEFAFPAVFGVAGVAGSFVGGDPRLTAANTLQVADLLCAGTYNPLTADLSGAMVNARGQAVRCLGRDVILTNVLRVGQEAESQAAYIHLTYHVDDALSITVGGRYSQDDKDAYLFQLVGRAMESRPVSDDWSKFTYDLKANYKFSEQLSLYASIATGYRSGGFNGRAGATGLDSWDTPYDEEQVTSYELGWKWQDAASRLRVNGALYFQDYEDRQLAEFRAGAGGATSILSNAGGQENQGVEIDVAFAVTEQLTLLASYAWLDAEFTDFTTREDNPVTGFAVRNAQGAEVIRELAGESGIYVPFAAEHTASLQLIYDHGEVFGIGNLSAWVGVTYSDEVRYNAQNHLYDTTDAYETVDVRVSLTEIDLGGDTNLEVALWGKNVTNEEIREWGIDFGALGYAVNSYRELATWGLDVTYNYQ